MTGRRRAALLWTLAAVGLAGPLAVVGVVAATHSPATVPLVVAGGVPADVPAVVPEVPPAPTAADPAADPYAAWASEVGARTGIPPRALTAYAAAEVRLTAERPGCGLSWVTLAGIARVESDHGRHGGRVLDADGRPDRPIVGVALDGSPGVAAIADTDGGALDGDPVWDRAVGPLQFLPSTWDTYGVDGDRDGVAEPQDLDDAALAAGRYLCAAGGDLSTGDGWWRAVLAYNPSAEYARDVLDGANAYAERSR
ncbi:lytic transglycosylase domain-containing protein [Actinophytocola gossypii]|uniref:Lytic murein transglycosylase n=1 Tax=Actinophytocola gossypii TaxID=2812003 RepID=A0ABT2J8T3_9PSEU|nr:lytic murein transglycosylase [Actinophytocola gossypii]MCT2584282.1 lytic murein transglycosylase [Actinophytocola gossypii]